MALQHKQNILKTEQLTFRYEDVKKPIFKNMQFSLNAGEAVLLLGPSGSGKSTLAFCLNKLYPEAADGELDGIISFKGKRLEEFGPGEINQHIGIVFQDPESQFCMTTVEDELAFGLENLKTPHEEIGNKIDEALELVHLLPYKYAPIHTLSGGQKQKLALACVLSLKPDLLILDEPTANLDPASSYELTRIIKELKEKRSFSLLIIEHRLDDWIDLTDRCAVLNREGELLFNGSTEECFNQYAEEFLLEGIWLPSSVKAGLSGKKAGIYKGEKLPLTDEKLIAGFENPIGALQVLDNRKKNHQAPEEQIILSAENLSFYKAGKDLLKDISFSVKKGEFVAIAGSNGSGKTTLSRLLAGLYTPSKGNILFYDSPLSQWKEQELRQKLGYVFQNPEHQFIADSVYDEIAFSLKIQQIPDGDIKESVQAALLQVDLLQCADMHPFSLSQGQKRRLSVASMLVYNQDLLLLDEPTFGQDARTCGELMKLMEAKIQSGGSVVMITHDMEIIHSYADKVIVLSEGEKIYDGLPDALWKKEDILKTASLKVPYIEKLRNDIGSIAGREKLVLT
ncbi:MULTISPECIES: ABC transporter ATP-binding protein [unclassified Cytobacillus]|uniref:ABC transporter ATP-binding protein n=1 Tax=unclassified Cytobacillus TaxID=2675268 RepID=UPI00203B0141|nr:ABC transporter ATP-binding protein [Cytobacillus sp. AMY 15.2]MCM3092440.1 energy-coupling factor ABC transporter ATP-binding protein [Cytobacillus sp. AMY 15.2]